MNGETASALEEPVAGSYFVSAYPPFACWGPDAVDEFRREGFARAQVDRIVAAAGVARGTVYFHFPSKEHVLLELQQKH